MKDMVGSFMGTATSVCVKKDGPFRFENKLLEDGFKVFAIGIRAIRLIFFLISTIIAMLITVF